MKNQILFDRIDSRFPAEVEFLAALVRKPSDNPPGDCAGHAELAARAADRPQAGGLPSRPVVDLGGVVEDQGPASEGWGERQQSEDQDRA